MRRILTIIAVALMTPTAYLMNRVADMPIIPFWKLVDDLCDDKPRKHATRESEFANFLAQLFFYAIAFIHFLIYALIIVGGIAIFLGFRGE